MNTYLVDLDENVNKFKKFIKQIVVLFQLFYSKKIKQLKNVE